MLFNSDKKYSTLTRFFHGFLALCIIAALIFIEIKSYFPKGSEPRALMEYAHIQAGLFVLCLIVPRILWRSANSEPEIEPVPGRFVKMMASLMHYMLYLVIMHVLAALWHHFIVKDTTLVRMFGR